MKTKKLAGPAPEFQTGQVWRMGEDRLQIELVGKWLIHYRQYTAMNKRLPTRFAARGDLQQLLSTHKAVLVKGKGLTHRTPAIRAAKPGRSLRPARSSCAVPQC